MNIIFACFLLVNQESSELQFFNVVKSTWNKDPLINIVQNEKEIDGLLMLIDKEKNDFRHKYLLAVKKDIEKIKKIIIENDSKHIKNLNMFPVNGDYNLNNPINNDHLNILNKAHFELREIFGDNSYVDLILTINIITVKSASFPSEKLTRYIDNEIERLEKKNWCDSPMVNQLYLLKCHNLYDLNRYEELYKLAIITKKMREKISNDKINPFHLGPISYEFQSLAGLKKFNEIFILFKNTPSELLDSNQRIHFVSISDIYASLALAYFETSKIDLACIYQELAVSKIYQFYLDRNHPSVNLQAKRLQLFLSKKGDFPTMRNLEDRFNLTPLPNNSGEK